MYKKCFQYAVMVALNYEEIGKHSERITKIDPFINKYKWEGINFPSKKDDQKKFEKNNATIAFNILYAKKEKIYPAYLSKHNSNCEKQVVLLMIPNREKREAKSQGREAKFKRCDAKPKELRRWHYFAVEKLISIPKNLPKKDSIVFHN